MNTKLVAVLAISILLFGIVTPLVNSAFADLKVTVNKHQTNSKYASQIPAEKQAALDKALADAKAAIDKQKANSKKGHSAADMKANVKKFTR
jgi:ATP/ADP translocase